MDWQKDFEKYFTAHLGHSSAKLAAYKQFQSVYISPTIIEERKMNVASMDIFSRLMMERIIFLGTPIDDYVSNIVQGQLLWLQSIDPKSDIGIYINSPGGVIYAGLGIYDTMHLISPDVKTTCTGMAASMASVLLAAGAVGKRSCLKHSRVMIHQPMGGAQGQASDIQIVAQELEKLKKELYTILASHTNQPYETIWDDSDRDKWMTSQEAKDYGLVDEILIQQEQGKDAPNPS